MFARICPTTSSAKEEQEQQESHHHKIFFIDQLDALDISDCPEIGFRSEWSSLPSTVRHFTHLRTLILHQYVDDDERVSFPLLKNLFPACLICKFLMLVR